MADQRSVMKEYRLLEQKRLAGGLSPQEEARLGQLRELVGPETGVGAAKAGFDVNAAAAKLRESLLPAGLRNRPPPMPEAAPEAAPEAIAEPVSDGTAALQEVWSAAPFAPLAPDSGLSADSLFDPETLGSDAPPEAAVPETGEASYDPNAQPYDATQQAWDPNAQPYDPAQQAWDPNAQPYDPAQQAWDPNAQPYDPAQQAWDPNAQPYDPAQQAWDPNAQPYDPAQQAWDPNAQPADATQQPWDPNTQPADATQQAWDPNAQPADATQQPWDPNAQPADATQPWDATAQPEWDATVQPAMDPALAQPWGEPVETAPAEPVEPLETVDFTEPAEFPEIGAAAEALEETELPAEPALDAPEALAAEPFDAGAVEFAEPEPGLASELEPAPENPEPEPLAEPAAEELLPFDIAGASAIQPGALPEGWGAEPPPDFDAALEPVETDALAGAEPLAQVDALPRDDAQSLLAPLGAGQELTSEDDAFAQGFQLESNGSFGGAAAPAEPAWTAPQTAPEQEDWESAPALDLGAMAPEVPPIDLAPGAAMDVTEPALEPEPTAEAEPTEVLSPPAAEADVDVIDVEELPIMDGGELLEELPPEPAAPPPPPMRAAAPPPSAPSPSPRPPAPAAAAAPVRLDGTHRVVVHTLEGLVKRGTITDVSLGAPTLGLTAQPGGPVEELPTTKVKAIFFMLSPGEKAPAPEGKKVRVTFTDGRQIAGFSPDYTEVGAGFFMIPADTRTNTGRIWVFRSAVKSVAVS